MEMPESSKYSWRWITESALLSHGACELLYVLLTSKASPSVITIYDGENTHGRVIAIIESLASRSTEFTSCYPIYCHDGLYVSCTVDNDNVEGVLLQWRELGGKAGG